MNKLRPLRISGFLLSLADEKAMPCRLPPFVLLLFLFGSGCAPGVAPLYRDFASPDVERSELLERVRAALAEAGWQEGASYAPDVVSTEARVLQHWGLYRIGMSLDVIPVGDRHVRVIFHPYRHFVTHSRGKIGYLTRRLERTVLPDLRAAFERRGLTLLDHAVRRDRHRVRGR